MKELQKATNIYLEEYGVYVTPYLTLEQIDLIIKGICALENSEFSERKMCEDGLILYYATDIGQEVIESVPYEDLAGSGLITAVKSKIKNIDLVKEGIAFAESFSRNLSLLTPKIMPIVEKARDLYGKDRDKE